MVISEYKKRLAQVVAEKILSDLEEYTIDLTIGCDIGKLYKDIITEMLGVKVWVCTYEVSDGKYQIDFYLSSQETLSIYSKATDTAERIIDNLLINVVMPYLNKVGGCKNE